MRSRLRSRAPLAALAALSAALVPALVVTPAIAAEAKPAIVVNEVEASDDWIELTNAGETAVDLSGFQVRDEKDDNVFVVPAGTSLAPGAFYTVDTNADPDAGFGLGKADSARLFDAEGALLDEYSWTASPTPSVGRCPDGTGAFTTTVAATKNTPNACTVAAADAVRINEVESSEGDPGDWVELVNTAPVEVDASGLRVLDSADENSYTLPAGSVIAAGGYLVLEQAALGFGLGGSDAVRLRDASGAEIDRYAWTEHAATTYGRCPDGTGEFATTATATKGAPNDCAPPAEAGSIVVNEVESNGDDTDWVELMNIGDAPVDLSGYRFLDNDTARTPYVLPAGSVVAPGAFFVIDQATGSNPEGFDFGLGNADQARLFRPDGVTLVASYAWSEHSAVTYGRGPDGTGEFATTTVSTKGAPNDFSTPLVINEIESSPDSGEDWVELVNIGATDLDVSGMIVRDSKDDRGYTIPAGTTIAAGDYLVVDALGFGLGGSDSVRLFAVDGTTLIDEYSWTSHAATTFGRCPDPSGPFAQTLGASKGSQNLCEGVVIAEPWPGGQDVRVLDDAPTFSGDMSGIDWEPSGGSAPGTLWAVQNGDGLLYRIVSDGAGGWAPDGGWASGKVLRYPDGTGTIDAEGVTVTGAGSGSGVYVSAERDNATGSVSRPAVLRYDVSGDGAELRATQEWNLAPDFPGLGANSGTEGVTWIPDAFLTGNGFVDQTTGSAYDPADYPGHGDGLFFVGIEGTASVYAYALMSDGSFARIATIPTAFSVVADVQFDPDLNALWVVCDDACGGRTGIYGIDESGSFVAERVLERPAGTANFANEGFAIADDGRCSGGVKPTFYVDDNDTDGFSLREGTFRCAGTGGPGGPGIAPAPVPEDELTEPARGRITITPPTVAPGERVTVTLDAGAAGETVWASLYSTPASLGSAVVGADGSFTVTIPAGTAAGAHRLAVQDAAGALIGWGDVTVTGGASGGGSGGGTGTEGDTDGGLAATGLDAASLGGIAAAALALVAAGAAAMLLRRRGSRTTRTGTLR